MITDVTIIHILSAGHALCGRSGTPDEWPEGEYWISVAAPVTKEEAKKLCVECAAKQWQKQ